MKSFELFHPATGTKIVGVMDLIPGCALASTFYSESPLEAPKPNYDGETEVFWNDAKTQYENGHMLVVTELGDVVYLSDCERCGEQDSEDLS